MSSISSEIIVDTEFRDLIPPLTSDEFAGLEADILQDGCLDALKIWDSPDGPILIDGHNRKAICDKHGFPYETECIPGLETRGDVKRWMIQHQRHRRNLNETQRAMLAGMLAGVERGGDRGNQYTGGKSPIGEMPQAEAAKIFNVGKRSVERACKVRERGIPELTQMVTAGQISVSAAAEVAKLPEDQQREIVAGGAVSIQEVSSQMHSKQDTEDSLEDAPVPLKQTEPEPVSAPQMSEEGIVYCGHCGAPAKAVKDFDIFQGVRYYLICQNDDCSIQTPLRKKREEVIDIWNRRL